MDIIHPLSPGILILYILMWLGALVVAFKIRKFITPERSSAGLLVAIWVPGISIARHDSLLAGGLMVVVGTFVLAACHVIKAR